MNALGTMLLCAAVLAAGGSEDPVEAGRKALDPWVGGFPWYDAKADDVRPVEIPEPWTPSEAPPVNFAGALQSIAYLALALILAALVYFLVRAFLNREPDHEVKKGDAAAEKRRSEALPLPASRPQGDLLELARQAYQAGRYAEAIVYLFSHQLLELDRNQLIHLAKGKTNRQYLRELKNRPPLRRLLEQTMVAFEDVFFGHHPIGRDRFESCWTRLSEFQALSAEGTA